MSGNPRPTTPRTAAFVAGSVAASNDSPAPSDTPMRIGRCALPLCAKSTSTLKSPGSSYARNVEAPDVKPLRYALASKPTTK